MQFGIVKKHIEINEQFLDVTGELPNTVVACVGGSNAIGLFSGFLNDPVDISGAEPLGKGIKMGGPAASLTYGGEGIIPAVGSFGAVAYGMKLSKQMGKDSVLINLSSCGDKDKDYIIEK